MDSKQEQAVGKLSSILPLLLMVKEMLQRIEKDFAGIGYYKTFRFNVDAPSSLPLDRAEEFTLDMVDTKKSMLKFKESFNENDLPNDLRRTFQEAFMLLIKNGLYCKGKTVYVGGMIGVWRKSVSYVLRLWGMMNYKNKVTYSQQAYDAIISYFRLIKLIEKLEAELASHKVL